MSAAWERAAARLGAIAAEPMSRHATVRIGGPADWYLEAESAAHLRQALAAAREEGLPLLALGRGSNLLVGDAGIRGLVIRLPGDAGEPRRTGDRVDIEADAGAPIFVLARQLASRGIRGLEWAEGIPGTLGGAAVNNAGAYGGCFADVADWVEVISPDGRPERIGAADLDFGYRRSAFTDGGLADAVIARVSLRLGTGDADDAMARVAEVQRHRRETKPTGASLGSTFRNLRGGPDLPCTERAWHLIDRVGLRGERIGAARISEQHPNYFINTGGATARDYAALIRLAQERVLERFGVRLEPEIKFAGEGFA